MASSSASAPSTAACTYPPLAEDAIDNILYKGTVSPSKRVFQRKPLQVDFVHESVAHGRSYEQARATIKHVTEQHRQLQVTKEEAWARQQHADAFTAKYAEQRLGTNGVPTVNNLSLIIARQRQAAASTAMSTATGNQAQSTRAKKLQELIRLSLGTRMLDLKGMELVHLPVQLYSTLLMQLGRMIQCVNVSRNGLRQVPDRFVLAFKQVETLIYKDNALLELPSYRAMIQLKHLRQLYADCNQLMHVPVHLPQTLQVLQLSRNRLTRFPNLHELTALVELDLAYNMLTTLPSGMALLHQLHKLSLNGNRLATLAMLPRHPVYVRGDLGYESDGDNGEDDGTGTNQQGTKDKGVSNVEAEKKLWRVEVDPATRETVYFHTKTKEITRSKPKCFQIEIPTLALPGTTAAAAAMAGTDASPHVLRRTKSQVHQLSRRYPEGWEIVLPEPESPASRLMFRNHLTDQLVPQLPPELDKLGQLSQLTVLIISGNQLVDLPPSLGKLVRLKQLEAENNRIFRLPDVFEDLQRLESVRLGMNALSELPLSFCQLNSLTELDLKLNRLETLPDEFGQLRHLERVDVSSNALTNLPTSILNMPKLTTVKVQNNPALLAVGFRADTIATGTLAQLLWELNHQVQCRQRGGAPPVPESVIVGFGEEVWSTTIHVHKQLTQLIAQAVETHTLDFHWKNLTMQDFPPTFFTTLGALRELRLSGHAFGVLPDAMNSLVALEVLQLRKDQITLIEDNAFLVANSRLHELDLEHNQLKTPPSSIGHLTRLRVLRASNNQIETLPESLGDLQVHLTDVLLGHNRLQQCPASLSTVFGLERLDLSYNQLESLDAMDFTRLHRLVSVRANVNKLVDLPASLGTTHLRELWVAGNAMVELPAAILSLHATLTHLKVQSNKISRLPLEFASMSRLELIESDGNPFKSPPPEVMALGIVAIRHYLHKRHERVNEITRLLHTVELQFHANAFLRPVLKHLIVFDAPGQPPPKFLQRADIDKFEKAVDQYVNGAFYLLPPDVRGADLVNRLLVQLQYHNAQRFRYGVLQDLMRLCALIRHQRWLDKVDFRYDLTRPWGRNGEEVGVYMVQPDALYDDTPDLPSIMSVIQKRVRHGFTHEAFDHPRDVVEDAIEHYMGVCGPMGVVHDNVPFRCGCEDLLRFGKMHDPCYRSGWTFLQVLYTHEEAERRVKDEQKIKESLEALRPQITAFLQTQEGEKRFHAEVKLIKLKLQEELKVMQRRVKKGQTKLRKMKRSYERDKKLVDKKVKENPKYWETKTLGEQKEWEEVKEDLQRMDDRVQRWTREVKDLETHIKQGYLAFLDEVVAKLVQVVGVEVRNQLVQQQRERAIEF
ncbi:TPA: hypothetical protein N0F65_001439, partial [Lagenidium giganteum]